MGFPGGSDGKESACNEGDLGLIPGLGRFPGESMAIHSSILAWRIPMTNKPGSYGPWGHKELDMTERLTQIHICIGFLAIWILKSAYFTPPPHNYIPFFNAYCKMLNIQKMKIMVSGPITSREIDGETVETLSDFIFLGSKITADDDCSHEIKRHLLLGRQVMTNLDSILKSRHYVANKGPSSQGYGFSSGHVWM